MRPSDRLLHLRWLAASNGWRRDGAPFMDGDAGPLLRWVGPGRRVFVSGDPSVMPEPLRQAIRALLGGFFALACPLCDARAVWLTVDGAMLADGLVQVVTSHRVRTTWHAPGEVSGEALEQDAQRPLFAIVHEPDCAAAPASIERTARAGAN